MDPRQFDALVRSFATGGTRRRLLTLLTALPLGGMLVTVAGEEAAAERPHQRLGRRNKKRNRKQRHKRRRNKHNKNNNKNQNTNQPSGGGTSAPSPPPPPPGLGNPGPEACAGIVDGPDPTGQCSHCCQEVCCRLPANQCNLAGLCCAPNCANRECGPDGCGRGGTCGCGAGGTCTPGAVCSAGQKCTCPSGQVCNPASGQCPGPPATTTTTTTTAPPTTTTTGVPTTTTTPVPCTDCPVSENCVQGVGCACGLSGGTAAPFTCCVSRASCAPSGSSDFIVAGTCAVESSCPAGYITCVATQPLNGLACQACCPPGSTCDPIGGFCRQCPTTCTTAAPTTTTTAGPCSGNYCADGKSQCGGLCYCGVKSDGTTHFCSSGVGPCFNCQAGGDAACAQVGAGYACVSVAGDHCSGCPDTGDFACLSPCGMAVTTSAGQGRRRIPRR